MSIQIPQRHICDWLILFKFKCLEFRTSYGKERHSLVRYTLCVCVCVCVCVRVCVYVCVSLYMTSYGKERHSLVRYTLCMCICVCHQRCHTWFSKRNKEHPLSLSLSLYVCIWACMFVYDILWKGETLPGQIYPMYVCVCVCVCMCVCVYGCMYALMNVYMYICMHAYMYSN